MLSDVGKSQLFTAVFSGKFPNIQLIKRLVRKKCSAANVMVDLYSKGSQTLMIAYPLPPKAAGITQKLPRRSHRHF
ncbi:MAG: hypothetical protein Q4A83_01550 [Bacillota bacterium]|nr:hypothetical protein [Bacillota bacterium]